MRVPVYQTNIGIPAADFAGGASAVAAAAVPEGISQGLAAVADVAELQARRLQAQENADQEIRLIEASTGATRDLTQLRAQMQDDPDYQTAPVRYKQQAEAIGGRYGATINDELRRSRFKAHFDGLQLAGEADVQRGAAAKRRDVAMAALNDTLEVQQAAAATATSDAEREQAQQAAAAAITGLRNAGVLGEADAGKMWQGFRAAVADQQVLYDLNRDPYAAAQKLDSAESYPGLDPIRRERFLGQALIDVRQLEARREADARTLQAEADAQQREMKAAVRADGRRALQTIEGGREYAGLDDLIARAETFDPDTARMLHGARLDSAWIEAFAALPPAEQQAEIRLQESEVAGTTDVETAARITARLGTAERIRQQTEEALDKDPMGWAIAHGVVEPAPLQPGDAESFASRGRARAAAEARYGIDVPPLTAPEAAKVVKRFNEAATADQRFDTLHEIVTGWHDEADARAAVRQLREAKLPARAIYAIEAGRTPGREGLGRQLMRELTEPEPPEGLKFTDDFEAAADAAKAKAATAYDRGVGAVLLKAQAVRPRAALSQRYAEDLDALQIIARRRVGVADRPAESAYRDLFGGLKTLDQDRFAHLVLPADADIDLIANGLEVLRGQAAERLMTLAPADPVQARQFTRAGPDELRRGGTWINDGDGMVLMIPGTGEAMRGPDGKPWRVSIGEALRAGKARTGAAAGGVVPGDGMLMP